MILMDDMYAVSKMVKFIKTVQKVFIRLCGASFIVFTSTTLSADEAAKGKILVEQHCARCHSIGTTTDSPNQSAPPFCKLASRYPLDNLQEALAEGISVGHKTQDMPEFEFDPEAINQIIAFLKSIAEKNK